jgi:hypothetical protein
MGLLGLLPLAGWVYLALQFTFAAYTPWIALAIFGVGFAAMLVYKIHLVKDELQYEC